MKANSIAWIAWAFVLGTSCGQEASHQLSQTDSLTKGYTDIMPASQASMYKALLPRVDDPNLTRILNDPETMWYDAESIVPGYQDSMGDPEGMRPNTIRPNLIDLAVPGGHARLFATQGRFNFPFGTGGLDDSQNVVKINFWAAPKHGGSVLPVAYWRLNWSRWRWFFPKGTVLGEVLFIKYSDSDLRVFEIRTRTRTLSGWDVDIFRPFPTARSLANAVRAERPDWSTNQYLRQAVRHLESNDTLEPYRLETTQFPGTFERVDGHLDFIPDLRDPALAKALLEQTTFTSVRDQHWKQSGAAVTHAASTRASGSIVPQNYQAGVFPVNEEFCQRCHVDAGRQISHFHRDLVLYGELWGEDETFSWHPFKNDAFVDSQGRVVNFNNDNRRIRDDFRTAGLVAPYNPATHNEDFYQELPRSWDYTPYKQ